MMKRMFNLRIFILTIMVFSIMDLFGQKSYDSMWSDVAKFRTERQPKSALSSVDDIIRKAEKEGNFNQMIQAKFVRLSLQEELDPDSLKGDIAKLEEQLAQTTDPVQRAMLSVLIATTYEGFESYYNIRDDDTKAGGKQRRKELLNSALVDLKPLAEVKTTDFDPLTKLYKDSEHFFGNDVLSMIASIVLSSDLMEVDERLAMLGRIKDFYTQEGRTTEAALVELKRIQTECADMPLHLARKENSKYHARYVELRDRLQQMLAATSDKELIADISIVYHKYFITDKQEELDFLNKAIDQTNGTKRQKYLKPLRESLLCPSARASVTYYQAPSERIPIAIRYTNVDHLTLVILDGKKKVVEKELTYTKNLQEQCDTVYVALGAGEYSINLLGGFDTEATQIHVGTTMLTAVGIPTDDDRDRYQRGKLKVHVVDITTGAPVANCEVVRKLKKGRWGRYRDEEDEKSKTQTLRTNAQGIAIFDYKSDPEFENSYYTLQAVRTPKDKSLEIERNVGVGSLSSDGEYRTYYQIFTDRSIYRPGQTIHASVIAYSKCGDQVNVMENKTAKFTLKDVNYRTVDTLTVTTDAFGLASADFQIPAETSVLGSYRLEFADGRSYVRVEEYKRPTFEAEMKPFEDVYDYGDTIEVKGVATLFSGVPVQSGQVKYTIETCKTDYWSYWNRRWDEQESGEVETRDDGSFAIPVFFDPELAEEELDEEGDEDESPDDYISFYDKIVMYRITAKVTNLAGETQTCSIILPLADKEFSLSADIKSVIDKSKGKAEFTIKAFNPKGQALQKSGQYCIVKGSDHNQVVAQADFQTDLPIVLPLDKMPAGTYVLKMTSTDSKGRKVEARDAKFIVFSPSEKKMDVTDDWLYCEDANISPTKSARVYFAPKEKGNLYMHYYLKTERELIEYRPINGEAEMKVFDIKYKEEYGDGVSLLIFYVKDGELHSRSWTFALARPEKHLKLEWATFRDKLLPGQDEEWVLNIKDKDNKPAEAHLIATMYDASLDQIYKHSWRFGFFFDRRLTHFRLAASYGNEPVVLRINGKVDFVAPEEYRREFDNLKFLADFSDCQEFFDVNTLYYGSVNFYRRVFYADAEALDAAPVAGAVVMRNAPMLREVAVGAQKASVTESEEAEEEVSASGAESTSESPDIDHVKTRSDFSETAFYQPNLLTDKDGNVKIAFHLPESLTEWQFLGFANTKEMDYGLIASRAKAQKDFMVQPNMPRFLRHGDKARIAASVINQTDKALKGTATMLLTDADTGEEVARQDVPFALDANATTQVAFDYDADVKHPMLVCKIVAVSDNFSDGEQNYLPVLDSRQRVLETIPYYIEQGSKDIEVKVPQNTFSADSDDKITLEYTDTPAWTVIQAIQTLTTPTEDDAFSYSASLYTNAIARHFVERMPTIRTVIEAWKNEAPEQLTSPLERNEELRNIVQRETPWMLYADKETEQRARLVELFDDNLLQRRINVATKKLGELQFNTGAWPWFKGMEASSWTTLTVTEHLASLHLHGLLDEETQKMMNKALDWLDEDVLNDYKERLKYDKHPQPSEFDLHYLYVSLVTKHKHSAQVEKLQQYYLDCVEKRMKKDYTIYGWAQTAVLLDAAGRHRSALGLLKSLREYSVLTPGQGRHYNTGRALYSWRDYKLPTQIAAMKAMKQFRADFADSDSYLHDMQLWLISQKQTQAWDNALNTVDAVDLLLSGDQAQEEFFHDPQRPVVTLNGQDVDMGKMTPGLGYFKTVVPKTAVQTNNTLKVTKDTPGLSWGAVYVQYTAKSEDVGDVVTELKVPRRYLVETKNADGTTSMRDLKEGEQLEIGQNVTVRLTVTADRDMDFVSLRCQRAACFEPKEQLSGYRYKTGQGYYQSVHDSNTDYFFDIFRRGTCTLDMNLVVVRSGHYSDGLANVQCAYSPSFAGHSKGTSVDVR